MVCTFFGHRDVSYTVGQSLKETLIDLIENRNVDLFYVGNHGNFDLIARKVLEELKQKYFYINYFVVLAYLPKGKTTNITFDNSIFPENLENVHPKYAICKRNRWMIDKADYVVTYVKYNFGGAAQFKKIAENKGKTVINLAVKTND